MVVIPAIDILGGEVVRLSQGDYATATVYGSDPVAVARKFEQQDAVRLHIVDLDAARGNRDNNRKKLRKIRRAFSGRIEVGGGIRTEDDIEELLDIGIDRLVVGTVFVTNYRRVEGWIQHYGNIFIAGIDALDGRVRVSGWEEETDFEDETIAERAQRIGICSIIYTNIARDGTLEGPDIEATLRIGRVSGLPMIHSGGIRNLEDIGALREASDTVIKGVIVGKALYEDGIDLGKAIETYQENGGNTEEW